MTQDPYKVLGISYGATEKEVNKAYRTLAKKYHPDLHPGDKEAERKMAEINAAYDQIKEGKVNNSQSDNNSGYSEHNQNNINKYQVVIHFIYASRYNEALRVLSEISARDADWYYYSALCNEKLGNKMEAIRDIKVAMQMQPNNFTYQKLYNQIQSNSTGYYNQSINYGRPFQMGTGLQSLCWYYCIANAICNCCCPFRCC